MKRKGSTENYSPKDASEIAALEAGKCALREYFDAARGRQADVSRKTKIFPPNLSKMARKPGYEICFEFAVLIEVATDGALPVEVLCPSRAEVFGRLLALRAREVEAEAA